MTNSQIGGKRGKGRGRRQAPRSDLNKAASIFGSVAVIRILVIYGITILGLIIGLIYGNIHQKGWVSIRAELVSEEGCHEEYNNKGKATGKKCDYVVLYTVDGVVNNGSLNNVPRQTILYGPQGNQQIEIEYNPKNPSQIGTPFAATRETLNIVLPIVIIFFSVLFYLFYKNRNNRVVKGIAGVSWAVNMIRR